VLKRKHRGGSTRRDAEFVVDVLNMVVHCAFREDQSHSDLAVAAAVSKEAEHLDLSIAQPADSRSAAPELMASSDSQHSRGSIVIDAAHPNLTR
jgi:hypothetical protein